MAIKYYPNRVYRAKEPAIDRVMAKRNPKTVIGAQNTASTALSVVLSSNSSWQVDSVEFTFSNTTARDFGAAIKNGRQIVENLNDYLWIEIRNIPPQKITLSPGFYTGTQLATELQTRLNANAYFAAGTVTFTVSYDAITGLYTIATSTGSIRYMDVNTAERLSARDSIAGHLFGLNATSSYGATIISDTAVWGLDAEVAFINQTGSSATSYLHTDVHTMTIDQAIHLSSNVGADVMTTYTVIYEEIV